MTPRSITHTSSLHTEDVSVTPASDLDSGDESLPPHTSEIGTLKKLPNHGTVWLGSSSGVYFVNTVRRAFSAALVDTNQPTIPASEDILTGEDADGRNYNGPVTSGPSITEGDFRRVVIASLGRPPVDRDLAMELVTTFFRCWHPLFPFLHGPRFLKDMDTIYGMPDPTFTADMTQLESRIIVTFQLVINIASLDRQDLHLPVESRIKSTADVSRVAGCFSVSRDINAIQLLIAAELYLVATISLRRASTVAGMILKMIYHAGLHRCPLRYASLSLEDCEIRKRIFWSAYALDRHLSLSLGDPNTVQDNDIDVCLSGRELHKAVANELIINPSDAIKMHRPRPRAGPHGSGSPSDDPRILTLVDGPQALEKAQREAAMTAYVHYGRLTGRIIEIFHKSIHARFQKPDAITFLNSDIEIWWNDLPTSLTHAEDKDDLSSYVQPAGSNQDQINTSNTSSTTGPSHQQLAPFFFILYQQLQLLLNRPRLSLDQSTAAFQHGLQMCIKASRNTIHAVKKHRENGQSMLLPGLLSAIWMAGLIIAFACQLGKYPKARACSDIASCLDLLDSMGCSYWYTVKNCHKVLSLLLDNIMSRKASANGFLSITPIQQRTSDGLAGGANASDGTSAQNANRKRGINELHSAERAGDLQQNGPNHNLPHDTNDAQTRPPPHSTASAHKRQRGIPMIRTNTQNDSQDPTSATTSHNSDNRRSSNDTESWQDLNPSETTPLATPLQHSSPTPDLPSIIPINASGSALYANPQDIQSAQSSHDLNLNFDLPNTSTGAATATFPDTSTGNDAESLNINDPTFWGAFDYNISDIFGAASWENMIGGVGGGDGFGYGDGEGGFGIGMGFGGGMGPSWGGLFGEDENGDGDGGGDGQWEGEQ